MKLIVLKARNHPGTTAGLWNKSIITNFKKNLSVILYLLWYSHAIGKCYECTFQLPFQIHKSPPLSANTRSSNLYLKESCSRQEDSFVKKHAVKAMTQYHKRQSMFFSTRQFFQFQFLIDSFFWNWTFIPTFFSLTRLRSLIISEVIQH